MVILGGILHAAATIFHVE